jgi:hypothetical protein
MNAKALVCNDYLYLITDDEALLAWMGNGSATTIPKSVHEFVENFINLARPSLEPLMCEGAEPGTILYWEENVHDNLVAKLSKLSGYEPAHISNSLSSLGF